MRDHTVCLLKECDSGCKMALDSMAQIKGYVSDQKLKNTIDGYEKKHQAMEEEAYKQLKSLGEGGKEPEMMAAAFSRMSTGMKMLMKDDNRQAAKILMDGCKNTGAGSGLRHMASRFQRPYIFRLICRPLIFRRTPGK